jgi:hypothetical protein
MWKVKPLGRGPGGGLPNAEIGFLRLTPSGGVHKVPLGELAMRRSTGVVFLALAVACGGSTRSGTQDAANTGDSKKVTLTITVNGQGSVSASPQSITCSTTCSESLTAGTALQLVALPRAGMQFAGWSGACAGTVDCALTLAQDTQVVAVFEPAQPVMVLLTVDLVGEGGGRVLSMPSGIDCPGTCAMSVTSGTPVTFTWSADSASRLEGFGGACSGITCAFTASSDSVIYANFSRALRTLTVSVNGPGTVTSVPAGISCPGTCAATFPAGSTVDLIEKRSTAATFGSWSGACAGSSECSLVLGADAAVTAQFAPDPCTGLMPTLPPAKTFASPGNGIDGSCGSPTTDGLGTVYNFGYRNGSGTYSSAGASVGGVNPFVPLASGFSAFTRAMSPTGQFSVFAPNGTLVSSTDYYVPFASGAQANGGSIIVSVKPAASCNDWEIVRFDDRFTKTSDLHFLNSGCNPGYGSYSHMEVMVDAQDRTLMVFLAQSGEGDALGIPASHYGARWFDAKGSPITNWFDAGVGGNAYFFGLTPLIGGGAALEVGFGAWATIPSGAAQVWSSPAGFTTGRGAHIVLGGRAYAMTGPGAGTIDIVEPGGKTCATLPLANDYYSIGKDGTVLSVANTVGPSGRPDTCSTTYYPQVLK